MLKFFLFALLVLLCGSAQAHAENILFIPQDNRPVSYQQPVEVIQQLGFDIISPPTELLTNPDELWAWFEQNAVLADAAVVSSDALLYGGLILSRSHQIPADILAARVQNFKLLRDNYPSLKLYAFGSLMRTPSFGMLGDREEPAYYGEFGSSIFQLTRLIDKSETSKLSSSEKRTLNDLQRYIPKNILYDWFARRDKNLSATKMLLDFTKQDVIDFFVIGRDDNAPLCQTHRENRQLLEYMKDIPKTKAQSLAGIDEFAMLLLARSVNDLRGELPFVNIKFNRGVGEKTIPAYSDEQIGKSIREQIIIAGGTFVPKPERADFVLFVNSDTKGNTFHNHNSLPPRPLTKNQQKYLDKNAKFFAAQVEDAVNKNLPVGVADITFANGSDNSLMAQLRDRNLLFKLQSYGGWNTATNCSGFALGTGILAKKMSCSSKDRLLARRFLDDWAYQANVRTQIAAELSKLPDGLQIYLDLGEHESEILKLENQFMQDFAKRNFPRWTNFTLSNPWHRMFECKIDFQS